MNKSIKQLKGANMDIDLTSQNKVNWEQSKCPWNQEEGVNDHKCAVKHTSICKYFCGTKYLDSILCSYPYENIDVLKPDEMDRELKKCPACGRQNDAANLECTFCSLKYDI